MPEHGEKWTRGQMRKLAKGLKDNEKIMSLIQKCSFLPILRVSTDLSNYFKTEKVKEIFGLHLNLGVVSTPFQE